MKVFKIKTSIFEVQIQSLKSEKQKQKVLW